MSGFTRRTHIVRISPDDPPSDTYIDVEILDAIAFRVEGNKEVVLDMDQTKSDPLIKDDTGGGHGKEPGQPTQRTHMKRIVNKNDPTQKLDVEVVDCAAFRDVRGEEWVLDMQPGSGDDGGSVFNISDGSGSSLSTRRVHNEIISVPQGLKKSDAGTSYLTSVRSDTVSFRKVRGEEVIINCPSADDKNADNVDFGRADTYISTPTDYDPSDDSKVPPTLKESGDKHNYVSFVDGADGFLTGDEKIAMGPFWWIRKVNQGKGLMFVYVTYTLTSNEAAPPTPSIQLSHMSFNKQKTWDVLDSVNDTVPGATKIPAVVNPVTNAMLSAYNQWTPAKSFQHAFSGNTSGEQIYWVDGSNADVAADDFGEGLVSPTPTLNNFFLQTYFVPGSSFPIVLTDVDPTPVPNPDNLIFTTGLSVLQARAPITSAASTASPAVQAALSPTNSYPTLAAATAAAAVINSAVNIITGQHSWRPAFAMGPIDISTGFSRYALKGSAVFVVNLSEMKATNKKYTAQIDVNFTGSGSVTAGAEVYKKLRNFTLDTTNIDDPNTPTFTPWNDEPPLPTKKDGGKFSSNGITAVTDSGSSGTLYLTIDATTLDVNITTTPP